LEHLLAPVADWAVLVAVQVPQRVELAVPQLYLVV
jgi:hypothetical protein